jgi:hypothetical protein
MDFIVIFDLSMLKYYLFFFIFSSIFLLECFLSFVLCSNYYGIINFFILCFIWLLISFKELGKYFQVLLFKIILNGFR